MIEEYDSQTEILDRIEQLKASHDCMESDMYVITKHNDDLSLLRAKTDVIVESEKRGWFDRFMGIVSGKQKVKDAFDKMDLTDDEKIRYYNDLENGKYLLYIDTNYCQLYYPEQNSIYITEAAPIIAGKKIDDSFDYDAYNSYCELKINDPNYSEENKSQLRKEKSIVDNYRVLTCDCETDYEGTITKTTSATSDGTITKTISPTTSDTITKFVEKDENTNDNECDCGVDNDGTITKKASATNSGTITKTVSPTNDNTITK